MSVTLKALVILLVILGALWFIVPAVMFATRILFWITILGLAAVIIVLLLKKDA
jgi:hypothetical protein